MDVSNMVDNITDFFNNIKTITNSIDFLPNEITMVLIPTILLICGLFIYRFIR